MVDKVGKDDGPKTSAADTAMPPPSIPDVTSDKTTLERTTSVPPTAAAPVARDTSASTSSRSTPTPARRPVFLPMALGGLVAGLIGYAIAWTQFSTASPVAEASMSQDSGDVQGQIDQLRSDLDALPEPQAFEAPEPFDASDIESQLSTLNSETANLRELVDTLTAAPIVGEEAQNAAVQSLSQQIAQQTAALQDQRDTLQAQLDEIRAEADQLRADAEDVRTTAVENARTETIKAALARVQGALETGAPMTAILSDLSDATREPAPQALEAIAEEGAPTLSSLRESFPDAAREALQAARASGGDGQGGLGSFLKSQLNVRSTAPREGTSVDAILSRAEDALRNGRLTDSLAEVETLPEDARAALSDWTARAQARADAVAAVQQLDSNLTAN